MDRSDDKRDGESHGESELGLGREIRDPTEQENCGKWVFTYKWNKDGTLDKRKARWVVRGFAMREGIDYNETHASTVMFKSVRFLCGLSVHFGLDLEQLDIPPLTFTERRN